jgi:hypothetical protein
MAPTDESHLLAWCVRISFGGEAQRRDVPASERALREAPRPQKITGIISDREPGSYKRAGRVISGVTYFAFASDLKDAGIDSPTGRVAGNVVKGILEAYRTQRYLLSKRLADYTPITRVTLLAGPAFFDAASRGIQDAIALVR